jgi:hypothetical protein
VYGHNHIKHVEEVTKSTGTLGILANPGELLGMNGAPTWGLYDTNAGSFTLQTLDL